MIVALAPATHRYLPLSAACGRAFVKDRTGRSIDALQAQLTDAESVAVELKALRDERDQVRTRVSDMLAQLDALQM